MAEERYWIEDGGCAVHKVTEIPVCTERIVKRNDGERVLIVGVMCHWLNEHGGYERGMLMTTELRPCDKQ
jgi:hypothetical protein